MVRLILIVTALCVLTGCPSTPDHITPEQVAQHMAELESARSSKNFWQTAALSLVSVVLLALATGAVLGSRAKKDADGK